MSGGTIEEMLADGLAQAGTDNVKKEGISVDEAMRNLAKPIAEAIKKGGRIHVLGTVTPYEISEMTDVSEGDIYAISEDGEIRNPDGSSLSVQKNSLVVFEDGLWQLMFTIDLDGYATKDDLAATGASLAGAISAETARATRAEEAIASSISGLETKADAKQKAETFGLMMRKSGTNTLQFYRPTLA